MIIIYKLQCKGLLHDYKEESQTRELRMQWNSKAGEFRALRLRIIFSSGLSDYFYILRVASPTLNICNIETQIAHLHTLRSVRSPIANTYLGIGKGAKNNSLVGNSTPDVEYASRLSSLPWQLYRYDIYLPTPRNVPRDRSSFFDNRLVPNSVQQTILPYIFLGDFATENVVLSNCPFFSPRVSNSMSNT